MSWGLGLAFGFTLNAMDVMSFYYLFLPTWIFTIVVYTQLAKRHGAAESYPEEEAKLAAYDEKVDAFHAEQAANEAPAEDDLRGFTKALTAMAWLSLGVTVILAVNTMFFSSDINEYHANRSVFFNFGFACTVIYFASAYWVMHRKKQFVSA